MGVYIKGMEMPKAGAYICELGVLDENTAVLTINTPIDEPQRSYRLVPVPPHGRLGDLDELKTAFPCGESIRTESVRATIDHMPTIIEAEGGGI